MSLPVFSTQAKLFSTTALSKQLFDAKDRYRIFAQKVYPAMAQVRSKLEAWYCANTWLMQSVFMRNWTESPAQPLWASKRGSVFIATVSFARIVG